MTSFQSARIRLTAWYVVISALIGITFSIVIYEVVTQEIRQGFIVAEQRLRIGPIASQRAQLFLHEEYQAATKAVFVRLLIMNSAIIASAGIAGYFLAGKVLLPLEEMVDDQKRFIGDASHELRTPLTTLRSEIEVFLRSKRVSPKAKELAESNLEEIQKMQDLVSSLLALSKYTDSRDIQFESLNLSKIAEEIADKHAIEAKRQKIKIEKNLEPVIVSGDKTSIRQLLSILLDNAVKYNNQGGVVTISTKSSRRNAIIKIADTGTGIPKEDLSHIFKRFYRVDPSRSKDSVEGYGLGLSIAKSIVELHKGEISVVSKIQKGTVFTVLLPK